MRRVFFEKDPKVDFLFAIKESTDLTPIFNVKNFTDESGMEYVYTLLGERNTITEEKMKSVLSSFSKGKYKNYNGEGEVDSAREALETMIDLRSINKDNEIYIYYRKK